MKRPTSTFFSHTIFMIGALLISISLSSIVSSPVSAQTPQNPAGPGRAVRPRHHGPNTRPGNRVEGVVRNHATTNLGTSPLAQPNDPKVVNELRESMRSGDRQSPQTQLQVPGAPARPQ